MLDAKMRHRIYDQIAKRYRRFNYEKSWKTTTVIDGKTFSEGLKEALELEEKRQLSGIERHEVKSKPKVESPEMPSLPIELLPEKPLKSIEEFRKEIVRDLGSVQTRKYDNVGFDDLEDLLKASFGNPSLDEHIAQNKELERQINENLEAQTTRNICPICKSSVCHCTKEGE